MIHTKDSLKELEDKCRLLEGRCSEYVNALQTANHALEDQVSKLKDSENIIKKSDYRNDRRYFKTEKNRTGVKGASE